MADEQPWSRWRVRLYGLLGRNPKSNRRIVERVGLSPEDHVLDLGCGPGAAVRAAAKVVTDGRAVGVDRSGPMIEMARRRSVKVPNTQFEVGAAEVLPFGDDEFTVVWSIQSFHHWDDHAAGIAEVFRVLAPGGRAVIVERDAKVHGLTDAAAADLVDRLLEAGFTGARVDKDGKQQIVSATCP